MIDRDGEKITVRDHRRCPIMVERGAFLTELGLAKYKLRRRVEAIGMLPLPAMGMTDTAAQCATARKRAPAAALRHRFL